MTTKNFLICHKDFKFTTRLVDFLSDYNILTSEDILAIINGFEIDLPKEKYNIKTLFFLKHIFNAKKIIVWGLFSSPLLVLLAVFPRLGSKVIWIPWGGDIDNRSNYRLKSFIIKIFKYKFLRYCPVIATMTSGDHKRICEQYNCKPIFLEGAANILHFDPILSSNLNKRISDVVNIQVGNSADPTNNHEVILTKLARFKDQNLRIFVPLSYGNPKHAHKIKIHGYKLFKDKIKFITKHMDFLEFQKFISEMDIQVFGHERQQGVGNITLGLIAGVKVFMSKRITTWNLFKNKMNLDIYSIDELDNMSFGTLVSMSNESRKRNSQIVSEWASLKNQKESWEKIFNYNFQTDY